MNKITAFLIVIVAALSFSLGATMQSKAEDKSFAGVVPFVTTNDRVGFFDQSSGKIYMYDDNISGCVFTGQMTALGQPIQMMSKS